MAKAHAAAKKRAEILGKDFAKPLTVAVVQTLDSSYEVLDSLDALAAVGQLGDIPGNPEDPEDPEIPENPPNNPDCIAGETDFELILNTDGYGSETTWLLRDSSGKTVASGDGYSNNQFLRQVDLT